MSETPDYRGHRERLRARFLAGGADAMPDYELLELLLFQAIPRKDTKPIAKQLLKKFGSFSAVISAPPAVLETRGKLGPVAVATIKTVQASALRLARQNIFNQPVLENWSALIDYLYAAMAQEKNEQFRLLFLDKKNRLIGDEVQQKGTIDHTPVYTREVVKRAMEYGASALILVHNHPSGDPFPSDADITMTEEIVKTSKMLKITVHDHIIIGKTGHVSFKNLGLIK